jgi:hypothetical protein
MNEFLLPLAQSDVWADSFFGLDDGERFVVVLTAIGCSTGIIIAVFSVIAGVWSSVRHKQIEAELKQDMLDRGMTAEEIEQVIEATPKEGIDSWIASWKKNR